MYVSSTRVERRGRRVWRDLRAIERPEPAFGSSVDIPNPDSEADHGEAVSVEDPHRQPHAASRNTDAELRVRSSTVGGCRQATRFPDIDLRVQDRRGWAGLLRFC